MYEKYLHSPAGISESTVILRPIKLGFVMFYKNDLADTVKKVAWVFDQADDSWTIEGFMVATTVAE